MTIITSATRFRARSRPATDIRLGLVSSSIVLARSLGRAQECCGFDLTQANGARKRLNARETDFLLICADNLRLFSFELGACRKTGRHQHCVSFTLTEGPVTFSYTASFVRLSVLASIVALFGFAIVAFLQKPGSFGQFSTCCLALAALAGWRQLRTITGPILVLTETGLTDHRRASKEIPWLAFTGIHFHPAQGSKTVILDVDPAQPGPTRWIRMTLRIRAWLAPRLSAWFSPGRIAALGLGERGLWISARGLDVDLETLYTTLESRMQRARPADR